MRANPPSSHPRYQALLQLLRTSETLWNASRMFFSRWDLSASQFNMLNVLYGQSSGCTQIELSRELIMHRSNVTGLVDRLEKRGLLQRKEHAEDRRAYRLLLTAKGRKLIEQILPDYYLAAEKIWGNFPLTRTRQLIADLQKLDANVHNFSAQKR